jgi:hypothetical protein
LLNIIALWRFFSSSSVSIAKANTKNETREVDGDGEEEAATTVLIKRNELRIDAVCEALTKSHSKADLITQSSRLSDRATSDRFLRINPTPTSRRCVMACHGCGISRRLVLRHIKQIEKHFNRQNALNTINSIHSPLSRSPRQPHNILFSSDMECLAALLRFLF